VILGLTRHDRSGEDPAPWCSRSCTVCSVGSSIVSLLVSDCPAPSHFGSSRTLYRGSSATACNCVRRSGTGLLARMLAFLPTGQAGRGVGVAALTRQFIHDHLSYRFVVTEDGKAALSLDLRDIGPTAGAPASQQLQVSSPSGTRSPTVRCRTSSPSPEVIK
jgi:hypothetical protein